VGLLVSIVPEIPAERYRREAVACRLKAEETANSVDKEAWRKLADDWDKLARGADLNQEWQMMLAIRSKLNTRF
jgi:hypothetical protein